MPGTVNTAFVLDMQRKLYRWSSSDPDKVFADLFNLVGDRRTLNDAWQRLIRNRGSRTPGTDGVTRRRVEERPGGAAGFLAEIREELRCGTYRPEPVRQRLIPKPGKAGKVRPLGIPTLKDRLVQMALKLILEPIFEADFYPTSYEFRKGRSTHDALAKIQRSLHPTTGGTSVYHHVIEGDIKGCFDAIDHHVLMERVRRRVSDRKVLRLILGFLKAGVMVEGTVRHPVTGSPQGGIISPLLSNILPDSARRTIWPLVPASSRAPSECSRPTVLRPSSRSACLLHGALRGRLHRSRRGDARASGSGKARAGKLPQRGTSHGPVDGKDPDHRCQGRLRLPRLPGSADQGAPVGALGRQSLHSEGNAE